MREDHWSRRRFIAVTAASAAVAVTAPRHTPGLEKIRPVWLGIEDLEPLRGERVRMVGSSGRVLNARVVDVRDNSRTDDGVTVRQYSVLLRTGLREPVEDYTFRIEHPERGSMELFCTAVLTDSRSIHYEATLGHLDT